MMTTEVEQSFVFIDSFSVSFFKRDGEPEYVFALADGLTFQECSVISKNYLDYRLENEPYTIKFVVFCEGDRVPLEFSNLEDLDLFNELVDCYDFQPVLELSKYYFEYYDKSWERLQSAIIGKYDNFSDYSDMLADDILETVNNKTVSIYFDYEKFNRDTKLTTNYFEVSDGSVFILE